MKNQRIKEDVFIAQLKELYKEKEVYTHYEEEDYEPYPYEMWLHDLYEIILLASRF